MSHSSGEPLLSFGVFDFYSALTFSWKEEIPKKTKRNLQVPDFLPLLLATALLSKQHSKSNSNTTVHLSPFFGKKYC